MAARIGKRLILAVVLCLGLNVPLANAKPTAETVTPDEVDAAIKKAVEFLYSAEKGDNWEINPHKGQEGGLSALAVYGLLAAGEKPQSNPKLAGAIEWLKKDTDMTGTYALGIRLQVWNLLPQDEEIRKCIQRDALKLHEGALTAANAKTYDGMWHYVGNDPGGGYDHSTSQYGTLGMWAAERAGIELPDALWQAMESQWKKDQLPDGGWPYQNNAKNGNAVASTATMTAAGIATLFITQDYLRSNDGIKCTGNVENTAIDKGMKWMEKNISASFTRAPNMYLMYGIERIGVASGYKYFGTVDWYKDGAAAVVRSQQGNGSWVGGHGGPVGSTAFGILFLSRGRAPVVMNKLQYNVDNKVGNWNQRPRDAANVVKYMMRQMERDLNWQIVNLSVPIEDLHDSPILYISGNQSLKFTADEEAKLKQFAQQGGLILGHADCGDKKFATSFKALGTKLFKYEFKKIDPEHPIYTRQQFLWKKWKDKPDLLGMSNGVRELMLLIPDSDPARAWQLQDDRGKAEQFQLMNDIFLYAVEGRDLRFKGSTYLVAAEKKPIKQTIKVGRLQVGDNWDPEPGGWTRLAAVMNNTAATTVETSPVKADAASLKPFKVAHLTGTTKTTLTPDQQTAIKDWVNGGGTLLIDAAGGSSEFAATIEGQLSQMFPGDAQQLNEAIPGAHALYNVTGTKLAEVTFRPFARGKLPAGQHTPLLRGITINGRLAVIYSREDLSGGLVGESIDGIMGYVPASATELMRNMVLFGGRSGAGPTSGPATAPTTKPAGVAQADAPRTPAVSPTTAPSK